MGKEDVVLLNMWLSPFAIRVRIALEEKGIEYESKEEDLSNKSPLLLNMNPVYKQIPVLIHRGRPISESLIILQYIQEVWNDGPSLLPSNPYDTAHARFWSDFVDKKIYPNGSKLWSSGKKEEEREIAAKELLESLKQLERELGEKRYFGGETFGLVDVALIPFYSMFLAFKMFGKMNLEAECPKLLEWAKRCSQRESVSNNLPDQQEVYDFIYKYIFKSDE